MRTTPREVQDFIKIKNTFKLSRKQKAVLIGTVLGDGSLKNRGRYHRLHIKHSIKQINLVKYKHMVFSDITSMSVRSFVQDVKGKSYGFCEFVTLTHPEFSKYYRLLYPDGKKRITKRLFLEFNDPLSLAVWLMDDGSADYAGVDFHTHSYSEEEVDLLRNIMFLNFNLVTTRRKNKGKWIIYIPKKQVDYFKKLVEKYMLSELMYKLTPYSLRS